MVCKLSFNKLILKKGFCDPEVSAYNPGCENTQGNRIKPVPLWNFILFTGNLIH